MFVTCEQRYTVGEKLVNKARKAVFKRLSRRDAAGATELPKRHVILVPTFLYECQLNKDIE